VIGRFAVVAELLPSVSAGVKVAGDGGRIVPNQDITAGAVSVALLDIPNVLGTASNDPTILIAARSAILQHRERHKSPSSLPKEGRVERHAPACIAIS
jgi:hypothetical protein